MTQKQNFEATCFAQIEETNPTLLSNEEMEIMRIELIESQDNTDDSYQWEQEQTGMSDRLDS
mgnify:FL=1|jgi:hypothetical protein